MDKIKELQGANMDTRIFMAKENDFETVKDITQTTIKLVYPKYYPEGAVQFFCNHHADDRILNDIAAGKVYLLEADDVCVGTVTISNNEICRLFVLPEYQHKGYGRLLMDYAEKMISKTNKTVVLDAKLKMGIICALTLWRKVYESAVVLL